VRVDKECTYDDVIKRGPKTVLPYNQPYPQISVRKIVEVQKESLLYAMEFVENDLAGRQSSFIPRGDDITLTYSIKAYLQVQLRLEEAAQAFEKARTLVMHKFDQMATNTTLVACSLFLGMYCIAANDERATFFLDTVKSFLERNIIINDSNVELIRMLFDYTQLLVNGGDLEKQLKFMIAQINTFHVYRNRNKSNPDFVSFGEMDKVLLDIRNDTDMYELVPQRVNYIISKMMSLYDGMIGKIPAIYVGLAKFNTSFYIQGAVTQRLFRYGNLQQATQVADMIARSTKMPYFDQSCFSLCHTIALAAEVHLCSDLNSDVLDCLQMELDALNSIKNKNRIVGASLELVVDRISYQLRSVQERILISHLADAYLFDANLFELSSNAQEIEDSCTENIDVVDQFFQEFM
jgi:hypothetical protein